MRGSMRTTTRAGLVLALLISAVPSAAVAAAPPGGAGSIDASFIAVAAPGPCLVLGGPSTVEFGQLAFGGAFATARQATTVAACPQTPAQEVLASVGNASVGGVAVWSPMACSESVPTACVTVRNQFAYVFAGVALTETPRSLGSLPGGALGHQLRLPAPGSAGGGELVTIRVTLLAVLR